MAMTWLLKKDSTLLNILHTKPVKYNKFHPKFISFIFENTNPSKLIVYLTINQIGSSYVNIKLNI